MDKKGIVDVSFVSWFVLIAIFLLMMIFIYISSGINLFSGGKSETNRLDVEAADSRVLMELFLRDEAEIDGTRMLVADALKFKDFNTDLDYNFEAVQAIEKKFAEDYSCDGTNVLQYFSPGESVAGENPALGIYINYPALALDKENFPLLSYNLYTGEDRGDCSYISEDNYVIRTRDCYTKEIEVFDGLRLTIKGDVKC